MKKFLKPLLLLVALVAACIILNPTKAQAATIDDLTFTLNEDGKSYSVTDCDQSADWQITIPATYNELPVTAIGDSAFRDCDHLEGVTIRNSITTIGHSAFRGCDNLNTVTIGNSVTVIGDLAFYGCTNLTSVTIPDSVTTIGDLAFYGCTNLTSVTIPDSVTTIGEDAFRCCFSLTSVTIPDSVTTIGANAFVQCAALTSVTIPDSVTTIGNSAFAYCYSLTSVTIPNSVTTIGKEAFCHCEDLSGISVAANNPNYSSDSFGILFNKDKTTLIQVPGAISGDYSIPAGVSTICDTAFYSCRSLTSVTIPDSVTTIGEDAFRFCSGLTDVYYNGTQEHWNAITIGNYNELLLNANIHFSDSCAKGHSWNAGVVTKQATCKETGVKTYTCSVCKGTRTETIAKLTTHTYNAATCTKPKTCKVCGATSGKALGHSYKTTTTKATLTKNGSIVKKCTACCKVASTTTIKYAKTVALSATSYTYNGKAKAPAVTVKDSAGKTLVKNTDYTVTYASGRINVGTYKVTVKGMGKYTFTKTLTFKINPIKASNCAMKLSTYTYTYNGKAKIPSVTVKSPTDATLTKGTSYTVSYESGRLNVGTYTVKVTMKGNYSGTKTQTFKINPIKASNCSMKLSATSYIYNGSVKTPTVKIVSPTGATLTKGTNYTVTYSSGRKNVGTYTVKVTMKGNYTGTRTLTFKINPAGTTVAKLTAGTKSITVGIAKKSTQVTGYQIQYSTSKTFSSAPPRPFPAIITPAIL